MAESSVPVAGGGAVTDVQYELIANRAAADGLIGLPTDPPLVFADGIGTREVRFGADEAGLLRGFLWESGSTGVTVELDANASGLPRVDLLTLRLNRATWLVRAHKITGAPAAQPVAPAPLFQEGPTGVWDLPVGRAAVAPGAVALAPNTVTPLGWYLGEDGQILCTPTTRPPHHLGRSIWEAGRLLVSDGVSVWRVLSDESGAVSLIPATGWSGGGNRLRRRDGWVHFSCTIRRTGASIPAGGTESVIGTIPAGFRPLDGFETSMFVTGPRSAEGVAVINTNGPVELRAFGGVTSGAFAMVAATSWPVA